MKSYDRSRALILLMSTVFCFALVRPATAQNLSVRYNFTGGADGSYPRGSLVRDPQGNLYGTSSDGGAFNKGIVFKLDSTSNLTVLHSFTGADGEAPYGAPILDGNGFLYGATVYGGPYNTTTPNTAPDGDGVIYKLDTSGNNFQVLHYFDFPQGKQPQNGLAMDSQGFLYGTTYFGGAFAVSGSYFGGVVFRLDIFGDNFQVLHSFNPDIEGWNPVAPPVLDGQGHLYGSTYGGSIIFKMDTTGANFQQLHTYDPANGWGTIGTMNLDNQDNLYGVMAWGGNNNAGVIFKMDTAGNNYQVLHHFAGDDGLNPYSGMTLDSQGRLIGTTSGGGAYGDGVIYQIDTSGIGFQVLHHFNGSDGASPISFDMGLLLDNNDNLFGTTNSGGLYGKGVVFQLAPANDSTSPTTNASLSGTLGLNNWYTSAVQVTLTATDPDGPADVAATYFAVDSVATLTYSGPFTITAYGQHTISYWSVDKAGNTEGVKSVSFQIDSVAPGTSVSLSGTAGTNGWYVSPVNVTLAASDATSGVAATYYSIDGGAAQTYSGSFNVSADGTHTVAYWSVDNAGNVEGAHYQTVKIDKVGPTGTIAVNPAVIKKSPKLVPVVVTLTNLRDSTSGVDPNYCYVAVADSYGVYQPTGFFALNPNGDGSYSITITVWLQATLDKKDTVRYYRIYTWVRDFAGNFSYGAPLVTVTK